MLRLLNRLEPRKRAAVKETFETVASAVILALIIRSFVIQPFKIPTGSMEPTLQPRDRILVLRYVYGLRVPFTFQRYFKFRSPRVGDIIVFNFPEDTKRDFIKRCVALPGDELEIRNGVLLRNGKALHEEPFNRVYYYNRGGFGREGEVVKVPPQNYFALGDNSASSKDSRYWGFLDDKYLVGKAVLIYWPLNRIRILK